jgi:ArsR family transcriptional regulator, nickel/cobalt-responsive transcriptional repressor
VSLNVAADRCAEALRVLADETRLHVVRLLLDGPRHVGQMNESIGIDQSLLSHHLRVMREAGLIVSSRDGKAVLYRLSPALEARRRGRLVDFGCCRLSFD